LADDGSGIAAFLAQCGPGGRVAVEASSPTWAFVDRIVADVATVVVVDTRKTRIKAGYAAKTDRLDARRLADALRRDSVVGIYYPPPAIRDLRELCRYRCQLARLKASLKQRIRALLLRQGVHVPIKSLFGVRGRAWLDLVPLTGWTHAGLTGLRDLLAHVEAQLAPVMATLQHQAQADPIARSLAQQRGFGPVLSVTLRADVGTIARFPDGRHLASYAGLVPRVEQSGGRRWTGHITTTGSPWWRWVLIEAAIHQRHRDDNCGRWARELTARKGIPKARVAIARALCDDVFARWPRG
jgi:transposase